MRTRKIRVIAICTLASHNNRWQSAVTSRCVVALHSDSMSFHLQLMQLSVSSLPPSRLSGRAVIAHRQLAMPGVRASVALLRAFSLSTGDACQISWIGHAACANSGRRNLHRDFNRSDKDEAVAFVRDFPLRWIIAIYHKRRRKNYKTGLEKIYILSAFGTFKCLLKIDIYNLKMLYPEISWLNINLILIWICYINFFREKDTWYLNFIVNYGKKCLR